MSACKDCGTAMSGGMVPPAAEGAKPVYLELCPRCDFRVCSKCGDTPLNRHTGACRNGHRL